MYRISSVTRDYINFPYFVRRVLFNFTENIEMYGISILINICPIFGLRKSPLMEKGGNPNVLNFGMDRQGVELWLNLLSHGEIYA